MRRKRGAWQACASVLVVLVPAAAAGAAEPAEAAPAGIVLRATGTGVPPKNAAGPQARLLAERAATVVALRNLAVKLGRARTDVKTGVIDVEAFLAGYRVSDVRYTYRDDDTLKEVEATVEISLDRLYGNAEAALRSQVDEANAKRAAAEAEAARLQKAIAQVQDELDRCRADAARATAERDRLASETEALRKALADAQNRLNVTVANAAAAEAAKSAQVADLQATIAALRKEVAELKAELERLRAP